MIASAPQDIAQMPLEDGKALPVPNPDVTAADADLIELLPLSVEPVRTGPEAARTVRSYSTSGLPSRRTNR
jgi:hypothetical protein